MGNPKTDSGEQKNPSKGSGSANSGSSSKKNPAKLPPAGFIYSDDENLMDELSMGWGLTASEEEDELDAVINKTVDMSKVSNTKLKALTEPPKGGLERIERVRAERASKELPAQQAAPSVKEQDEREAAAKRAKQAAAEREEAARAAAQREKAERELSAREAAEREAALKSRAEEEAREKKARELRAREERERAEHEARETAEREARDRLAREQEEEEARERAALEARLLERAEQEARDREAKEAKEREEREARDREERAEELRVAAAAREKAEREAAEREEAEREIAERERLQKEAAAKLKAKQEQARKEAEEEAAREREEQELAEKELAGKEKLDKAAKSEKENAGTSKGGRVELPKKEIKAQRIGGPKTAEEKKPDVGAKSDSPDEKGKDATKQQPEVESKKESPVLEKVGTTSKLSRTPEEELAALLAEDEAEQIPKPPEEKARKPIIPQDAKTSRSGLAAMEPTDDTPLTGMLKAIKPADREKSSGKVASEKTDEPAHGDALEAQAKSSANAEPTSSEAEVQSKDDSLAEGPDSADVGDMLASEIDNALSDEESGAMQTAALHVDESSSEAEVPEFLRTETEPKSESSTNDQLGGVDKFYKPERVKLSDFVRKKAEGNDSKLTEKADAKPAKQEKVEKKESIDQAETAALQILKLPEPAAKSESAETEKPTREQIRESVKQESPEKKAALIAALKKLEDQVDESDLSSLSTDSLKDVLAKLPDLGTAPLPSSPDKKDNSRKKTPSPAVARLASAEEPTAEREIAREKLKVMQKMAHTLPVVKSYLPQKRALLIIAAVLILGILAAVMTVRAETISARQALSKKDYNSALSSLGVALTLYPLSAEAHFLKGSALYLSEKYEDAYKEYDTALKLNPGMRDALERRAAVSYRLGNYSQSVEDYEKLLQQEGEQSQRFDQLLSLANAYLRVGDLQKAADMYNRCLDRKPNYIAAMVGKIAVSNEKKLYERAIIEAGKALAASPANKDVLIFRARAYTAMRDFSSAQKDLDAAIKKYPKSGPAYAARANLKLAQKKTAEAYADFENAIKLAPKDSSILLERSKAYIDDRKLDLAAKDIAKAKQLMGAQQTAQLYIVNAQLQIASKRAAKALDELKEAEEKFPRNLDIILSTADALSASGRVGEGILTTEKAMQLDKTNVDAIVKHGLLSVKFGNKMRATEDFGEAIKLDPKNVIAYKNRGMLFLQQEKFASAQEDLAKVLSIDPTQGDAKAALDKARIAFAKITRVRSSGIQREGPSDAYLASLASKPFETLISDGYNAYKKGDYLTAVPTLEQAVKVNSKDPRARRYLAFAYRQADQLGEAAGQFEVLYTLGALGPQDVSIFIEMLMGSGQQEKALKIVEDAIAKNPGNQILYLHLATCQSSRGENDKAVQTCNRGIAINPRSSVGLQLIDLRKQILNTGSGDGNGGGEPAGA